MSLTSPALRLRGRRVVLASASPRRKEILGLTGVALEVVPPRFPETLSKAAWPRPQDYARETATGKAQEVAARLVQEDPETPTIVIGADTVVAVDGRILEKPKDREDALGMLRSLSGKQHQVITGVAIVTWGGCEASPGPAPDPRGPALPPSPPDPPRRPRPGSDGLPRGDERDVLAAFGGADPRVHGQRRGLGQGRGLCHPGARCDAGAGRGWRCPQRCGLPAQPLLPRARAGPAHTDRK